MAQESNIKQGEKTRERILNFIIEYISEHGYSPTVREIGNGANLKSTSSVQTHILRLIDEGKLETDAPLGTPRAIRVPGYKFVKEEHYGEE